jgi:peptidoglycan hydrolase-like protein with peptidoglycan-binding domain
MTITTKATAKVAAVAAGLAMATSMLSLAPLAHAQTTTTTTTTTTAGTACSVGTADLTLKSSGPAVTCLQQALIAGGYSIPAGATGYFGTQTQAAVAAWQAKLGVTPAAGYFGPKSRAAFGGAMTGGTSTVPGCMPGAMFSSTTGAACTTTTTTVPGCTAGAAFSSTTGQACSTGTTSTAGLTGSGRLTNVDSIGDTESDLDEGDSATNVVGISADATGGDVAIQRVDATFTIDDTNTGSSANLNKYVSDVSLYLDGTKLASMDPAKGDKDGRVWTIRFSGLNGVIKSGKTGNLYVRVTPVSSIGENEDGETVTATLEADSVRAVAADGISDTYVGTAVENDFTVSTATNGTLTVSEGSTNPKASIVAVSSSTTSGVTLLNFNMKAKNQDVTIHDLKAELRTSDNSIADVVSNVKLMKGSTVVSSKSVSGSGAYGSVTFSNIDKTIAKDSTENYSIVVDLRGDSQYADGVYVVASTTVAGWDVEDADGASVTPSAAVAGNNQTLTATGISVKLDSATVAVSAATVTGAGDTAQYTLKFTVTAGDDDVYIAGTATRGAANTSAIRFATTTTSTTATTNTASTGNLVAADTVTGDSVGSYYKVLANTSRQFTLNVTLVGTSTTGGYTGVVINGIAYGTSSSLGSSYTANLDTFKTNDQFLKKLP